jgi:hypothetical protein
LSANNKVDEVLSTLMEGDPTSLAKAQVKACLLELLQEKQKNQKDNESTNDLFTVINFNTAKSSFGTVDVNDANKLNLSDDPLAKISLEDLLKRINEKDIPSIDQL